MDRFVQQICPRGIVVAETTNVKEKVIDILRKHPEGLHILGISRLVGAHRHTVTKYVYELIGAEIIRVREIGTLKLCFLDEKRLKK